MKFASIRSLLRAAAFAGVLLAAGCSASNKHATQKQEATQEWNAARAAVLFSLASDQFRTGHLDAARKSIDEALSLDPQNPPLRVMSARIDIEQGRFENAQGALQLAGTLDPKNSEVDYLQGVIAQRWQKPQQAHDFYAAASAKKPDDLAYLLAQSEMLVSMNRAPDALQLLLSRVVYFENSGPIRDAVAQLYEQTGQLDKALEYFRQATVLDGDDDAIRERFALALYRNGNHADALAQLTRLLKKEAGATRADLMVAAAECEMVLGRGFDARERFEKAAYAQPASVQAWQGVAKASIRLGDLRRAEMAAGKAVALVPGDAQSHLLLGFVRMRQGRADEAMVSFDRASRLDPTDPVSLCMIGVLHERGGRNEDAIRFYGRALRVAPSDELAGRLLADASAGAMRRE